MYAPVGDDSADFISRQMQTAYVRVRGVAGPEAQQAVVNRFHQNITQFARFCDNQHRLAERDHTHYRVVQGDVEMQYINNQGQPLIYVTPAISTPDLPENIVVERDESRVRGVAIARFYPSKTTPTTVDISSILSGATVTLSDHTFLYFSKTAPDDLLDAWEDGLPSSQRPEDGKYARVRLGAADDVRYLGMARGYMQHQFSTADLRGGDDEKEMIAEAVDYVEYTVPVPTFAVGLKMVFKTPLPEETYSELVDPDTSEVNWFATTTYAVDGNLEVVFFYTPRPDPTEFDPVSAARVSYRGVDTGSASSIEGVVTSGVKNTYDLVAYCESAPRGLVPPSGGPDTPDIPWAAYPSEDDPLELYAGSAERDPQPPPDPPEGYWDTYSDDSDIRDTLEPVYTTEVAVSLVAASLPAQAKAEHYTTDGIYVAAPKLDISWGSNDLLDRLRD